MTFERDQQWFGEGANQTLEPEFQYLYVPYKDQDNIGVYDSTTMRQDYYSLFSDRRFAGLDRISDSNRLSLGSPPAFMIRPGMNESGWPLPKPSTSWRPGSSFTAAMS